MHLLTQVHPNVFANFKGTFEASFNYLDLELSRHIFWQFTDIWQSLSHKPRAIRFGYRRAQDKIVACYLQIKLQVLNEI